MCRWNLRMLGSLGKGAEGLQNGGRGSGPSGRSSLIPRLENQRVFVMGPAGPFVGQVCLCSCVLVFVCACVRVCVCASPSSGNSHQHSHGNGNTSFQPFEIRRPE